MTMHVPGTATVNVGVNRGNIVTGATTPGPGDYSPDPAAIGVFQDMVRTTLLLRALPTSLLKSLHFSVAEELKERGCPEFADGGRL
ncbi:MULTISPECIES: hypothetical protein [unclassified Streptomyces]|uniref:hypothetical protein n=1 Tax=unclassified Streptomyces TaxID=2593676 RepID=UPI00331BCDE3